MITSTYKIALFAVVIGVAQQAMAQYKFDSTAMGSTQVGVNASGTLFGQGSDHSISSYSYKDADFFDFTGIWMMGKNAGSTFACINTRKDEEVWPGPIDTLTRIARDPLDWNEVWIVTRAQVEAHMRDYMKDGYQLPDAIRDWPADHSDQFVQTNLAPYVDWNSNQMYDPENGDYPAFNGDKVIYTISNDQYGEHLSSGTDKMIVEQLSRLYVYDQPELTNILFGTTYFINRSTREYAPFYVGHHVDFRLGNDADNRIFTDVSRNLLGAYNDDANDEGVDGFGNTKPIAGICYLNADLHSTTMFVDGDNARGFPGSTSGFENVIDGLWTDGAQKVMNGDGTGTGSSTRFIYPGTTDPNNTDVDWNEANSGESAGPRSGLLTTRSASLPPGDFFRLDYAIITDTSDLGKDRLIELADYSRNHYRTILSQETSDQFADQSDLFYPNPWKHGQELVINKRVKGLIISDYLGRNLIQLNEEELNAKKYRLSCSELYHEGVYLMNVQFEHGNISSKLVITGD